jgi:hypothetical protein
MWKWGKGLFIYLSNLACNVVVYQLRRGSDIGGSLQLVRFGVRKGCSLVLGYLSYCTSIIHPCSFSLFPSPTRPLHPLPALWPRKMTSHPKKPNIQTQPRTYQVSIKSVLSFPVSFKLLSENKFIDSFIFRVRFGCVTHHLQWERSGHVVVRMSRFSCTFLPHCHFSDAIV